MWRAPGHRLVRRATGRVGSVVGGPARTRAVLMLAAVLALNSADSGTIGAVAAQLERDMHISHAQLGLLTGVSAGVGALASLPLGVLADRTVRVRLLVATVVGWALAMAAGGLAPSYGWLLVSRLALGVALAAAGPVVASLVGDLFPPAHRARVYGWVLSGEVLGAGTGLVVSGDVAALMSWRYAFHLLALMSLCLAVALWRWFPEPARGGQSWIPVGAQRIPLSSDDQRPATAQARQAAPGPQGAGVGVGVGVVGGPERAGADGARAAVAGTGVEPVPERTLRRPAGDMPLWRAVVYLLGVPTNRMLIVASSIGYFFFAGIRTFAVVFVEHRFGIAQSVVTGLLPVIGLGALAGVVLGGRITDARLRAGAAEARVVTPAVGYVAAAVLFAPGLLSGQLWVAVVSFTGGAAALASANPPLDAARLDIVPAALWGRAESVRTLVRLGAEAAAPALFGLTADRFGGTGSSGVGLRDAFLIMLLPLLVNGMLVWRSRRHYPADVATAAASDRNAAAAAEKRKSSGESGRFRLRDCG